MSIRFCYSGSVSERLEIVFLRHFRLILGSRASLGAIRAAGPEHVRQSSQNDVKIEALRHLGGRLGAQRRAQRGSGWAKVVSDRAAGGVRSVILTPFDRLCQKL